MRKLYLLVSLTFLNTLILAQTATEKLIFDFNSVSKFDLSHQPYRGWLSFIYDKASGTYVYVKSDTTREGKVKYVLISNKGTSRGYDSFDYGVVFDEYGNYYSFAFDTVSENKVNFYLIKNGNNVFQSGKRVIIIGKHNRFIYFTQDENYGRVLYRYDYSSGKLSHGKAYYMIYGVSFTKDNKPFFLAQSNKGFPAEEKFYVIDDKEQKHYSDIFWDSPDASGYPVYLAKKRGRFQSYAGDENINSGMFLVYGNKEYRKLESISRQVIVNESGIPVYVGRDFKDPENKVRLIIGDNETGNAYYNISELGLTPEKKIIFIADINKSTDYYTSDFNQNAKCVVYNGIEGDVYVSIKNLKVYPKDRFIYIAEKKGGEKVIVTNDGEVNIQHPDSSKIDILDAEILPDGKILCAYKVKKKINSKWEDKSYIRSGDEVIGPFLGFPAIKVSKFYFQTDGNGNYTIMCVKKDNDSADIKDYIYSNTGISSEHDGILYINFYNGKVLYEGAELSGRNYYSWRQRIYYDFKPVSPEYDQISPTYVVNSNFKFDESAGILTFVGLRDYRFYDVEIKFQNE